MSVRPLPPFGRSVVAMLDRHERPAIPDGTFVAALAWDVAPYWPGIVLPDDPDNYRMDFARGLDWLVLSRVGHSYKHVAAVVQALRDAGAHVVAPVTLPYVECEA